MSRLPSRTTSPVLVAAVAFAVGLLPASPAAAQEHLEQIHTQFDFMEGVMATDGFHPDLRRETGSVHSGSTHAFPLSLLEGVTYRIVGVCDTDCSDVDLLLYDEGGEQLAEDVLADDVPIVSWTPAISGTYVVELAMIDCAVEPCYWGVQPYSTDGDAAGTMAPIPGPVVPPGGAAVRRESGSLEAGDATLQGGEYVDEYTFTGQEGDEVVVDLRSTDFDPYLIVRGPRDEQEDNDDYEGDVNRSLVRFELPTSGTWTVGVTSYAADDVGRYALTIQTGAATASAASVSTDGRLEIGDETLQSGEFVDELTFEGSPGERVGIDLRSNDFDTYVMLLGPGNFRHENDDADVDVGHSRIEAELSESGTYRVLVTSYAPAETGQWSLNIERGLPRAADVGSATQPLQIDRPSAGVLEPGDGELESGEFRDFWAFEATAGQDVTVEVTSADFDTYAILIGPDGSVIDENDDVDGRTDLSRISARLPRDGRYRVVATSYGVGESGRYDVTVRSIPGDTGPSNGIVGAESPVGGSDSVGQVYGVFVGVSDYGGRASDLAYTADDAHRAADALVTGGGMDRSNAIVLTDREATVANVREAFSEMGRRVGPDDTFVYFYSGHGARAPRSGPEHPDPDALDETIELFDAAIRDNEMSDLLDLIDSNVSLLVLDACFSGGFSKDVISVPGRMGFFSSEEDVTSQVASKFRAGGYLAQFVFDGIGERLADADGDGAIRAIELSQYIHERYRSDVKSGGPDDYVRTGGPQTGFQHFVADRGSIGPDRVLFR